jgi:hypothetical protein
VGARCTHTVGIQARLVLRENFVPRSTMYRIELSEDAKDDLSYLEAYWKTHNTLYIRGKEVRI